MNERSENIDPSEIGIERQEESVQWIGREYASNAGLITKEIREALQGLPAREAFRILLSENPPHKTGAIFFLRHFPDPDTVSLLEELYKDPNFLQHKNDIRFITSELMVDPRCSEKAIALLKEWNDPKAIYMTENGSIEAATKTPAAEILSLNVPAVEKDFLLKEIGHGGVFLFRNNEGEIANFAIINKYPGAHLTYLAYIYTGPNHRKQGYAEGMIEYVLKHHTSLKCELYKGVELSEKTLQKLGFKKSGMGEKWEFSAADQIKR
ncbi:N-acetyltransferase [bacterium]|nr:MAG: N-acetyltransferase [bacterium]